MGKRDTWALHCDYQTFVTNCRLELEVTLEKEIHGSNDGQMRRIQQPERFFPQAISALPVGRILFFCD